LSTKRNVLQSYIINYIFVGFKLKLNCKDQIQVRKLLLTGYVVAKNLYQLARFY